MTGCEISAFGPGFIPGAYRAAYNTDTFRDEGRVESRRPSLLHLSPGVSPLSSPRVRCSEGEAERPTTVAPPLR